MEQAFQERIARAKEAARLASLAAIARGSSNVQPAHAFPAPILPTPIDSAAIPGDVLHRIDRLLEFIARNGTSFEQTVMQRERGNPDFAFLFFGGPYHEYYEQRKLQLVAKGTGASGIDPVFASTVGAMANACIAARQRGLPTYASLPDGLLASAASLHSVEPARLATRLAEFYRRA